MAGFLVMIGGILLALGALLLCELVRAAIADWRERPRLSERRQVGTRWYDRR